jgi:hypothetical protein
MLSGMDSKQTRLDLVVRLVKCQGNIESIQRKLDDFPFDTEPLVTLEGPDIMSVLERFLAGALSVADVEDWANALEGREDVGYDRDLAQTLFVLSTPAINGPLTADSAASLIRELGKR